LASTYEWKAFANKADAYVNEAIYLKYVCEFSDRGELYAIDFNPVVKNDALTIKLLSETAKLVDDKKVNVYEFVAFVHVEGETTFAFEAVMKKTNRDSIENTVMGRDNADYEEFTKNVVKQKAVFVNVKDSKKEIVGTLDLTIGADEADVKAFEPYHIEVALRGNANFGDVQPMEFKMDGVKVFSQIPTMESKLTKEGYVGKWSQKFAFVSEKDFKIPAFEVSYFDLRSAATKNLRSEERIITIKKGFDKKELLDEAEKEFVFNYDYLYCFLAFLAGFFISKIKFKSVKKMDSKEELFRKKIKKTHSLEEILFALILDDSKKYADLIFKIENKELRSPKEVKKLILN